MPERAKHLDREIASIFASGDDARPERGFANSPHLFNRVKSDSRSVATHRWIGKCKRCGAPRQVVGHVAQAFYDLGDGKTKSFGDAIVSSDGVYWAADLGTNPTKIVVPCDDHYCALHRVFDDAKPGKRRTECGARCVNATGPSCDCRCKGLNHGSNLPGG